MTEEQQTAVSVINREAAVSIVSIRQWRGRRQTSVFVRTKKTKKKLKPNETKRYGY
jgi:hypothetical protein